MKYAMPLGVGTADSWTSLSVDGALTRSNSRAAFGRNVPLPPENGHWSDNAERSFPLGHRPGNPRNIPSPKIAQFG